MQPYLVSFTIPTRPAGIVYNSTVVELSEAPLTTRAVSDLQASIAMDYGAPSAALLAWDWLPDNTTHPSGKSPYGYFITFSCVMSHAPGGGSLFFVRENPIRTLSDVRDVEEWIRSHIQAREVCLVSCKALKDVSKELLQDHQSQQTGKHD